ncbi:MAG TPA: hypothetical protein VD866_22045, partial [Urbifossiella sp.]|nr:hypothetical protein [Urbifossiella sp.]
SKFKNLNFSPLGSEFARRLQEKDTDVGAELTKFQEKAKDRPSVRTLLVPPVNAGGEMKFDLMMPGALSHYTDRIEIRSWCKAGFFMIESVPGLDGARRRTLKSEADKLLPKVDKGSAEPGGLLTASGQPDPMLQPGKARGSRPGGTPFPAPPKGLPELPKVAEVEPKDGRSLAKPKTAVDLLYPGSLWKGSYPGRLSPKGKTVTVEFAVTSRAGTPNRDVDGFVGKMKLTDDTGIAARPFTARGSITKGGEMTWQHSYVDGQGEDRREIYDYRAKLVKENVLDVQCVLEGKAVVRSFRLEYVPPR